MPSGTLEVLLVGATGIKDTEIFGKGDPYCILTCGRTQARSNTAQDQGSKPVWNQKFTLGVDENTSEICISIYNKNLLEDDELGSCIIPLSRIYNSANKLPTTSFSVLRPSGRQQGEIKLSMTFVPKGMGGQGYGTNAPIQPYGPSTPTPVSFPTNMQYPSPNPNLGSTWKPPPPAGPPFNSRPGYGDTNPIAYPPPPPMDPYRRLPSQHDPYGASAGTSGPHNMQPDYGWPSSYGPYGVAPPGPGYGGLGPPACFPPLSHPYGNAPKHDMYGVPPSQPHMGGYGGPIPPTMGFPTQMPLELKTNGAPPAGYPKAGSCGPQTGNYMPPATPNDPYGNAYPSPLGGLGYSNVDAAAAGIAALGLAGVTVPGDKEIGMLGNTRGVDYGSQTYPPIRYPPPTPGYRGVGFNQPLPANYTPAGYPAVYGTHGSSRGTYELHHEGSHKTKKSNKDKKKKNNKKGKRK